MAKSSAHLRIGCALGVFMLLPGVIFGSKILGAERKEEYSIVINAGSSSSNLLVSVFKKHSGKLHVEKTELYKTFMPGLSDFYGNPQIIREQIEKMLKKAEEFIPNSKWDDSPVTFVATAGFRHLSRERQDYLLEEVRKVLAESNFKKTDNSASILSEPAEGMFTWVTANLLLDHIQDSPDKMVATLDLRDASTQITFPITSALLPQFPSQVRWFPVAGKRVNYYTRSYMGLSIGAATVAVLLKGKHESEDFYDTPCVRILDNFKTYHYNGQSYTLYRKQTEQEDGTVHIEECTSLIQNIVGSYNIMNYDSLPKYTIFAISGFFHVLRDAGFVEADNHGQITVSQMKDTATIVCRRRNPQVDPFLCLHLIYIHTLLTEGFKIKPTDDVVVIETVNGRHINNWATGLAYYSLELESMQEVDKLDTLKDI